MHVMHIAAVLYEGTAEQFKTLDAQDLELMTTAGIETVGAGWSDWWAVGGRWDDYLTAKFSKRIWPNPWENRNAILLTPDNIEYAIEVLEEVSGWQAEAANLQLNDSKEFWSYLNGLDNPLDAHTSPRNPVSYKAWSMQRLVQLVAGEWCPDSHFLDTHMGVGSPHDLLEALKNPESTDPTNAWVSKRNPDGSYPLVLIVVDLHY